MKPIDSGSGTSGWSWFSWAQQQKPPGPTADTRTGVRDTLERGRSTGPFTTVARPVGDVVKGLEADRALPQRYRFRPLNPGGRGGTSVAMIIDMKAGKVSATTLNPRGDWLLRFDGPDKGTPRPHLNLNRNLTGFKDPHRAISPTTLATAGRAARVLEAAGKVARPVAIATDTIRLADAVRADGGRIGPNTAVTAGSVAGGWGGAIAGAWVGAKAGAVVGGLVGSIVPGIGTAAGAGVGGVVGGIIGGIGGAFAGSEAGERLAKKATQ